MIVNAHGMIVDAHLDLAHGVNFYKRNLERSLAEIRASEAQRIQRGELSKEDLERGIAMVSLPELQRGRVALVCGTLFATPAESWTHPGEKIAGGYNTPEEAEAQALADLRVYEDWAQRGLVRLLQSQTDLNHHMQLWLQDSVPGLIVLMEGADPVVAPKDLRDWWARGVRIIGTSWGRTRYAGGTDAPGGLTELGHELVQTWQDLGGILDVSHQSWEAFWDTVCYAPKRIIASHSNSYSLTPTSNRHLPDDIIKKIGEMDGRIGIVMFNRFLEPSWTREDRRVSVTLQNQVQAHLEHMAKLVGWDKVGIGSDTDGGLGQEETPEELHTIADLHKISNIVPEQARAGVMGQNWLNFFRQALPK